MITILAGLDVVSWVVAIGFLVINQYLLKINHEILELNDSLLESNRALVRQLRAAGIITIAMAERANRDDE